MQTTGAELIVKLLEDRGIRLVAGIPGGAVLPLYSALAESRSIRHILARHEQAAGSSRKASHGSAAARPCVSQPPARA